MFIVINFIVFLAYFISWIAKRELSKKSLFCFVVMSLSLIVFEWAIELLVLTVVGVCFTISSSLFFLFILYNLPTRKIKTKKEHLQLARAMDLQYKTQRSDAVENLPFVNEVKALSGVIRPAPEKRESPPEIDFSHVKSVIERLEYYNLSQMEKKQVKELENALLIAEKSGEMQGVKQKINDGLGALLKIMSKHGV